MIEDIRNIKPGERELKKFGITMGIFFLLLGGVFFWRKKEIYPYLFAAAVLFLFLGARYHKALKFIYKIWMTLAVILGWVMTRVVLGILFFIVATPIGLLARAFGENFLDLKFNKKSSTYWIRRPKIDFSKQNYTRQF